MRRERGLRRPREAVLRAIEVGCQHARDIVPCAKSKAADERHRRDVVRLRELVPVDARQLLGQRTRRSRQPAFDLLMRARGCDGFRQGLEKRQRPVHPPRRNLTDVEDDVLRERGHDTRVRPDDENQVGSVRPDPSPQDVRFNVLAVRHA